ncbi:MAG: TIGR00296 family protein [Candidatus Micrarchaeaceae archaeon]
MRILSLEDGKSLVSAARNAVELYLKSPHFDKNIVKESIRHIATDKYGVFVTIEYYPTKTLRGCIGFPRAYGALNNSVVEAALAAAAEDPRFVPVSHRELDELIFEVSILSEPKLIGKSEKARLSGIKVGRDGLMVEYGFYSGLLLPIVAVEEKWNKTKFLEEVCLKAGLPKDYWKQPNVNLYKFETQVFREESPRGAIVEVKLE